MATSHNSVRVSLTALSPEHFSAAKRAMSNILASKVAIETYAQVVNGMPVPTSQERIFGVAWWLSNNPDPEPSEEARHISDTFQNNFNIEQVQIDAKVAQRYQDEKPASRGFYLRLIEIVAILCHDIAATLFDLAEGGLRKPVIVKPPGPFTTKVAKSPYPPYITLLAHPCYQDHEFYPRGSADIVGYWAEDRLFGGVVLFDRGSSGVECNGIFLNPGAGVRIFQLTEAQLQSLIGLLTQETLDVSRIVLPLEVEAESRLIHPQESLYENVYRNQYDRRAFEYQRPPCVVHPGPEEAASLTREYERLWGDSKRGSGGS